MSSDSSPGVLAECSVPFSRVHAVVNHARAHVNLPEYTEHFRAYTDLWSHYVRHNVNTNTVVTPEIVIIIKENKNNSRARQVIGGGTGGGGGQGGL